MHPPKQFKLAVTLAVSYFTLMLGSFLSSISLIDFFHPNPIFDVGYVSQPKQKFLTFLFWILQPPTSWIGSTPYPIHHPISIHHIQAMSRNYLLLALCGDFLYSYLPGDGAVVAQEVTLSPSFAVTWAHRVAVLCYGIQLLG